MKKTKLLICMSSVAALGSTIAPIVTSCSCGSTVEDTVAKYKRLNDGTYEVVSLKTTEANVTIPDKVNGQAVTSIGFKAFENNKTIKTVTIPATVKTIKDRAFMNCSNLTEVKIADGTRELKKIYDSAFCGCANLAAFEMPTSLETIEAFAFQFCLKLGITYIPKNVTTVGIDAFNGCNSALFLIEAQSIPSRWNAKWNSSNRPYVLDCNSETKIYEYIDESTGIKYHYLPWLNSTAIILTVSNYEKVAGEITIPTKVSRVTSNETVEYTVAALAPYCFPSTIKNVDVKNIFVTPEIELSIGCFAGFTCANVYLHTEAADQEWKENFESTHDGNKVYDRVTNGGQITTGKYEYVLRTLESGDTVAVVTRCYEEQASVTIDDAASGQKVVEIAPRAFSRNATISELKINGDSAINGKIGDYAFANCNNLKKVNVKLISTIGKHAFSITTGSVGKCGVEEFMDDSPSAHNIITSIGESAFDKPFVGSYVEGGKTYYKRTQLTTNIFGDDNVIASIGAYAFKGCAFNTGVQYRLYENMSKIKQGAFSSAGYGDDGKELAETNQNEFKVSTTLFNKMKNDWKWTFEEHTIASGTYYTLKTNSTLGLAHIVIQD